MHQRIENQEIAGGDTTRREGQASMSPTQFAGENPVERQVECHRKKTDVHRRAALVQRVEGVDQYFERRIARQADGVVAQRTGGLLSLEGIEAAMLVEHGNNRLGQHHQADGAGNRHQERQPHTARQLATKRRHIVGDHQSRQQRQCDRTERDPE